MPLLTLSFSKLLSEDVAAKVGRAATDLAADLLGKAKPLTAVQIVEVDEANWFVGGETLRSRGEIGFSLRIAVTAGTNTKDEIARFVGAVYETVGRLVGPLAEETYVIVDETPAANWGYGGLTQERRYIAKQLSAPAAG